MLHRLRLDKLPGNGSSAQGTFIDRSHILGTYGIDTRVATPVEETSQVYGGIANGDLAPVNDAC